jgi:hypothetical protein
MPTTTTIYARQGDLVIQKTDTMPDDLVSARNLVLAGDKSAAHTLMGPVKYAQQGLRTMIRVAKATTIEHAGRHKPVKLTKGDYVVWPLRERGDVADRRVED